MICSEAVDFVVNYYKNSGKDLPSTVSKYIEDFPPGFSRQVIKKKFNLNCLDFLMLVNTDIVKKKGTLEVLYENVSRLGYELVDNLGEEYRSKDRVDVRCKYCSYVNNTTLDSLRGSTLGCPKCKSGNLQWKKREAELDDILINKYNCIRLTDVPNNHNGFITVMHIPCKSEYTTQMTGIVLPNTPNRGTCPNCRSTDRRVTVNGITFGSNFELECYNIIKHLSPDTHVKYSDFFTTSRRWVCDFKVGSNWIEVSNFKSDYKNYFSNINDKKELVESNGCEFHFISSIKDLSKLAGQLNNTKL